MRKIKLRQHPELFQGEKKIQKNKPYFEGYYFKITSKEGEIAFIPGVCEKHAFIQVLTATKSYYLQYDLDDFSYHHDPFWIKIKDNYFSMEKIIIEIHEKQIDICGKLIFNDASHIRISRLSPNIMGPFSYLPFMECHHAILAMKNCVNGFINLFQKELLFENAEGYIEKDWGTSFPKKYLWAQANHFLDAKTSFMLAIADIPYGGLCFQGFICVLCFQDKEYRLSTYQGGYVKKIERCDANIEVVLKQGHYLLTMEIDIADTKPLMAPIAGNMEKTVFESITSKVDLVLQKNNEIIFQGTSPNAGIEIV